LLIIPLSLIASFYRIVIPDTIYTLIAGSGTLLAGSAFFGEKVLSKLR